MSLTPVIAWLAQTALRAQSAKARGTAGELLAVELFRHAGYITGHSRHYKSGDAWVYDEIANRKKRLEVKISKVGVNGEYKFCLRKESGKGKTDYRKSDVLVLICLSKSGSFTVFVTNTVNVGDVWNIGLPGKLAGYAGKYAGWKSSSRKVKLPCDIVANSAR